MKLIKKVFVFVAFILLLILVFIFYKYLMLQKCIYTYKNFKPKYGLKYNVDWSEFCKNPPVGELL